MAKGQSMIEQITNIGALKYQFILELLTIRYVITKGSFIFGKSNLIMGERTPQNRNEWTEAKIRKVQFLVLRSYGEVFGNRTHLFQYLEEKVRNKLSSWKATSLSFTGKLTLIKSVITTIPYYAIQTLAIPMEVYKGIDQLCHNFLWGGDSNNSKVHLMSGKNACKPKKEGGLGVKKCFRTMNEALLATDKLQSSRMISPLGEVAVDMDPNFDEDSRVSDFVLSSREWDISRLSNLLPINELSLLSNSPFTISMDISDQPCWWITSSSHVTIKSIYDMLKGSLMLQVDDSSRLWQLAWKWKGLHRIGLFLLMCLQQRLLTNKKWVRHHLSNDSACSQCSIEEESTSHVLRNCLVAKVIWTRLLPNGNTGWFNISSIIEWFLHNLNRCNWPVDGISWGVNFGPYIGSMKPRLS
ncbi:Reverse transcriptase zinc-binding domain - like 3 [Theobroma cacao]|nr:Reverse transcriptase zinc-binding domain - like 3 [Theobroma cacao]